MFILALLGSLLPLPLGAQATASIDTLVVEEAYRFGATEADALPIVAAGRIAVSETGDEVYLADPRGREIVVLGLDGTVRRTIGRAGQGPGEFSRGPVIGVYRDTLLAGELGRVHVFLTDGTLVRTVQLQGSLVIGSPIAFSRHADGWLAQVGGSWANPQADLAEHRLYSLDIETGEGVALQSSQPESFEGPVRHFVGPVPPTLSGTSLVVGHPSAYELAFLTAKGDSIERAFPATRRVIEDSDIEDHRRRASRSCENATEPRDCRRRANRRVRDARRALGESVPPIRWLVPSSDGCVLAKRQDLDPSIWDVQPGEVYDRVCPDLETRDSLRFPTAFSPSLMSGDVVWGWERSRFDVPILVGYRLLAGK